MKDLPTKYANLIADDLFRIGLRHPETADRLVFQVRGRYQDASWTRSAVVARLQVVLKKMLVEHNDASIEQSAGKLFGEGE